MDNIKNFEDFLDRMQGLLDSAKKQGHILVRVEDLENTFPELRESEDKKIRGAIIDHLKDYGLTEWAAWLEKQCEQTDINPSEFDIRLNKLLKQFETLPKEELASSLSFYLNVVQNDGTYKAEEKQGEQPRYSIGDVLCDKSCTTLNKDAQPNFEITDIRNGMYICDKCSFPISQQDEYELVAKKIEQKPAEWSEEDEEFLRRAIKATKDVYPVTANWLKSLKDRIQPKQEWSEEDEKMFSELSSSLLINISDQWVKYGKWLKSLKGRITWKPTVEQLASLTIACDRNDRIGFDLTQLLEELKKL